MQPELQLRRLLPLVHGTNNILIIQLAFDQIVTYATAFLKYDLH